MDSPRLGFRRAAVTSWALVGVGVAGVAAASALAYADTVKPAVADVGTDAAIPTHEELIPSQAENLPPAPDIVTTTEGPPPTPISATTAPPPPEYTPQTTVEQPPLANYTRRPITRPSTCPNQLSSRPRPSPIKHRQPRPKLPRQPSGAISPRRR
jgi:hypothetical protein